VPESRHKYLYERLGDHDFQQLAGALLTLQFTDFVPLPLRQADGGRDGVDRTRQLVYQVKWSATGQERDPVAWLDSEIRGESEKNKTLASEGVRRYALVTNVASTSKPKTGTFDKLNAKLDAYSKEYGLEMSCVWREALNSMVDTAPPEVKWTYADMLAGWDLIRYLVSEQASVARDSTLRDLLHKVAAAQWDDDARIKFSQVELDREYLADLFVDVPAERIRTPRRVAPPTAGGVYLGGAAAYIASKTPYPFTLVRGAPGQGKSTLSQFVCQAYRIAFLPNERPPASGLPSISDPRFPIRLDLADYAAWMQGYDVFDKSDDAEPKKGRRRVAAQSTVESYLAEMMTHVSGRETITRDDVQDIFDRVPSVVVFDGLDEVGKVADRKRVVREIDLFCARGKSYAVEPKVIVTTRPNSAGLPEPNADIFETISLVPLDPALRDQYLRKWCVVHGVRGNDSRTLRRNFSEKTREPYIGELAGNPMQLTILLYLLKQHGDATPNQRTELYDAYMALLLAREANKHPESVRKHRTDLMEIVPFLGWYIQSRAEEDGHSGRMSHADVEAAMKHFQRTYGKPEDVVDELFEAATDRLWALTSKEEGTFEFEVLPLREYFAARFLYRYAGEGDPRFDRTVVFRELLRRPYWLNTVRFYSGNAVGSDIYILKAGIEHEVSSGTTKHVRVAAWSLLTDGVFNSRPQEAASIVDLLTDEDGGRLLLAALDAKEISPLPESSYATLAWTRLTAAIAARPDDVANEVRVRVIRELLGLKPEFTSWWIERLSEAVDTGSERAWLAIGASCEVAAGSSLPIPAVSADDGQNAQLILNAGFAPQDGSALEAQLLRAVLDGQCTETTSVRSEPARIAVALSPAEFYAFGPDTTQPKPAASSPDRRSQAIQHLRRSESPCVGIASLRRFRRGERGSTFPWANTAAALLQHAGRCWLVSEIAIVGAASPMSNGFTRAPGTEALGSGSHPATLIEQTRANRSNAEWWRARLVACQDDLAYTEWALALWAIASGPVIDELFGELTRVIEQVTPRYQRAFQIAAQRLGEVGFLDRRPVTSRIDHGVLAVALAARSAERSRASGPEIRTDGTDIRALASVVRRAKWLKVDQIATYR
jgi:hypothetical protein